VVERGKSTALHAYLLDQDSGMVVAVAREFVQRHEDNNLPAEYSKLAQTMVLPRCSLAALGKGTLILSGGKRTPSGRLIMARAKSAMHPQAFQWEVLPEPLRIDDLQELRHRMAELPPSALRPRRLVDNFHVLKVAKVEEARFIPHQQAVRALLKDAAGNEAQLVHYYTHRGRSGVEALLQVLTQTPQAVCFIAGQFKLCPHGIEVYPTAVIIDQDGLRSMLQPWVDSWVGSQTELEAPSVMSSSNLHSNMLEKVQALLMEFLLVGLRRSDQVLTRYVGQLSEQASLGGFTRLGMQLKRLAAELEGKHCSSRWCAQSAVKMIKELLVLSRMGQELR
jgi:hypothetical protein